MWERKKEEKGEELNGRLSESGSRRLAGGPETINHIEEEEWDRERVLDKTTCTV